MTDENARSAPDASTEGRSVNTEGLKSTVNGYFRYFSMFTMALLIICIAAAGYYWETQMFTPALSTLENRISAVETESNTYGPRLEEMEISNESSEAELKTVLADVTGLAEGIRSLGDAVKVLYGKDAQSSLTWVLAEAEYLILAGMQRLALEQDVKSAIAVLSAADDRLRSAEHLELMALREQIKQDLAILRLADLPDVEALAVYLGETGDRVDDLPIRRIAYTEVALISNQHDVVAEDKWERIAKAIWNDVLSLVEISDGTLPDSGVFDPMTRRFLQQRLRLELASARLSVLRRDKKNFGISSKLIIELLNQHYDTKDASVAAVVARLQNERERDLNLAMPDISGSLDTIRSLRLSSGTANATDVSLSK